MSTIKYFLKIYIRNLFIHKRFAWINVIGLSIAVTVSLLILVYVRYETSFDNFNPNSEHIYRVITKNIQDGTVDASTPLALSDVLKKDFPEIDKVIGLMPLYDVIRVDRERFSTLKGAIVEKDFFSLFNVPLISGDLQLLFKDPFEAVLTDELASRLFGNVNPIGKTLQYEDQTFTVTGIIQSIPSNSIFSDFDYFLSDTYRYKSYPDLADRWYHFGLFTFITFKGGTLPDAFESGLSNIEKQYYPDFMKNRHVYNMAAFKGSHLNDAFGYDLTPVVAPLYLWILSAIALGILAIACLNFINTSIANAGKRNIETGIKKVHGAVPRSLIGEVSAEMMLVVLFCLVLGFFGMQLLLPAFGKLVEKEIIIDYSDPILWLGFAGFGIVTALGSSLYPALVFSKPAPLNALFQRRSNASGKLTFQKGFVVLQFAITIVLGIALLFISKQISFLRNHELGFDKENLIAIPVGSIGNNGVTRMSNTVLFTQTLEKYQSEYGYGNAAITEFVPGFGFRNNFKIFPGEGTFDEGLELLSCDIDENFIEVYGLRMVQGRYFSKDHSTDADALIINESALKKLGWNSIDGKWVGLFSKDNRKEIIGVINDINVASLQQPIGPMIYQFGRHHNYPGYITLRLDPEKRPAAVGFIKTQWQKMFSDIPFEFESIDEKYKAAYGEEAKLIRIIGIFSILAILLSLLGILALSALECEKRTKEIGIRRVNGADIPIILVMLNKNLVKWVVVAFVVACPVGWYVINKWLENFAYKTAISWWVFAAAGAAAMAVALITVSMQSYKAATRNPVEALRYE